MESPEINKKIVWQDLTKLSFKEKMIENNLTLPWLLSSLMLAYYEYYILALPFSAFFFLTALRQVHNGFHNALGKSKKMTWWCLYLNSVLMMVSVHAVKFNHLRHHKFCLREDDYEGKAARMTWYQAILYGPIHMFSIHWLTLQIGNKSYKKNVIAELISIFLFGGLVFYFQLHFLMYHIMIMLLSECLMAFFAVWLVHHDTHEHPNFARTQRTKWKNVISFNMFYHLEHHLFPAVPTIKLPELAKRMDKALPHLEKKNTF